METALAILLFVLAAGYLLRRFKKGFAPGQSPCAGCAGCSGLAGRTCRRPTICERPPTLGRIKPQ